MSECHGGATGSGKLRLRTLLAEKPWNMPLRDGTITSDLAAFDFHEVKEVSGRFKAFVREYVYDCGELAVVTYLQAKAYGKPFVLLPFVVTGTFHHKSFAYNAEKGDMTTTSLAGKRVGVKTYSQTTGVWVRGILENDYGVDLSRTVWVTFEDAHVPEHTDPANCERAPEDKKLVSMLLEGEVDGAMLGSNMPDDPRLKKLFPDPEQSGREWFARYGVMPINHMLVVRQSLCDERPDVVRELYRMIVQARPAAASPFPSGFEGNWRALELASEYAFQQGVIPRRFSVEELFEDAMKVLNP